MQEVFEKIIGKLDKLTRFYQMDAGSLISYEDVVGVIKAEAEEYNNGWIPVSEYLPAEKETVIACTETFSFAGCVLDGKWYRENLFSYDSMIWQPYVIAWQPLPPRYESKEDEHGTN